MALAKGSEALVRPHESNSSGFSIHTHPHEEAVGELERFKRGTCLWCPLISWGPPPPPLGENPGLPDSCHACLGFSLRTSTLGIWLCPPNSHIKRGFKGRGWFSCWLSPNQRSREGEEHQTWTWNPGLVNMQTDGWDFLAATRAPKPVDLSHGIRIPQTSRKLESFARWTQMFGWYLKGHQQGFAAFW